MSKAAIITGAVLGTLLLASMWVFGNFNSLVTSRAQVDNSWAKVESQYQRRLDLIDNLVASVKGGQKQEVEVFGKIADARKMYNSATTPDGKVAAVNAIETSVALLRPLQEAYPDLKSNTLVQTLMGDVKGTEDGILAARDNYNNTATNYNVNIQRFPKNLFAMMFNFEKKELFHADQGANKAPKVSF